MIFLVLAAFVSAAGLRFIYADGELSKDSLLGFFISWSIILTGLISHGAQHYLWTVQMNLDWWLTAISSNIFYVALMMVAAFIACRSLLSVLLFSLLVVAPYVLLGDYMANPLSAWDGLDYWQYRSHLLLDAAILDTPDSAIHAYWWDKHPATVSALSAFTSRFLDRGTNPNVPWWLCVLAIVHVLCSRQQAASAFAEKVCLLLGLLATPLLLNHVLLWGYAELFVAAMVCVAIRAGQVALRARTRSALVGFLVSVFFLAQTKNTGAYYAAIIFFLVLWVFWQDLYETGRSPVRGWVARLRFPRDLIILIISIVLLVAMVEPARLALMKTFFEDVSFSLGVLLGAAALFATLQNRHYSDYHKLWFLVFAASFLAILGAFSLSGFSEEARTGMGRSMLPSTPFFFVACQYVFFDTKLATDPRVLNSA